MFIPAIFFTLFTTVVAADTYTDGYKRVYVNEGDFSPTATFESMKFIRNNSNNFMCTWQNLRKGKESKMGGKFTKNFRRSD